MSNHGLLIRSATMAVAAALFIGAGASSMGQATSTPAATPKTKAKTAAKTKALLDLNKATAKELEENLPGVGEVTAKKIVAGRPYSTVDDLAKAGIPARTIEAVRPLVTVGAMAQAKEAEKPKAKETTKEKGTARVRGAKPEATAGPIDLNTAKPAELETLPGVGPALAKAIVEGRPYRSVDDLDRVKGLGKARIDALRGLVVASSEAPAEAKPAAASTKPAAGTAKADMPATKKGATKGASASTKPALTKPVNINTASKEELDLLPGIGPVKAQAIIDTRTAAPFKTIEDIMKVKGIKEGEFSKIKDLITVK